MQLPDGAEPFNYVEVRFKNGRKCFFENKEKLSLSIGDVVATEAESGHDIGIVTLTGELVKVQMRKKKVRADDKEEVKAIYRKASQKDIDVWQEVRGREDAMKVKARQIAIRLQLKMKISDIEFQGDGSKATFYYTAEERVDFRQLIKEFAHEFKARIEMRQIGFRQEASRLGGIGSCGRELCCSTWLTDFRSVTTSAARYQQLSLNPLKLAGQCGNLKCCLNYELDAYVDALKEFPKQDTKLFTEKGKAVCQKIDIFKGAMWFAYEGEWMSWFELTTDRVKEIMESNKKREPVASLEEFVIDSSAQEASFKDAVGEDSLTRFDRPKAKRDGKKRRRNTNAKSTEKNANTRSPKAKNPNQKNTATKKRRRPKNTPAKGDNQTDNTSNKN